MLDLSPLRPPPRPVPLSLALGAMVGRWTWVFACSLVLVTGLAAPLFLEPQNLLWSALGQARAQATQGQVTEVEEGAGKLRFRPVSAVHFRYEFKGKHYSGTSYAQGAAPMAGAQVEVWVWPEQPSVAVVKGLDAGAMAPTAFLLPLGLALLSGGVGLRGLMLGLRGVSRLRGGLAAQALLTKKEPTGQEVNGFPVVRLRFELGGRSFEQTTLEPERYALGQPLWVLHPPGQPQDAVPLQDIAPRAVLDAQGGWSGSMSPGARGSLIYTLVCGLVGVGGVLLALQG